MLNFGSLGNGPVPLVLGAKPDSNDASANTGDSEDSVNFAQFWVEQDETTTRTAPHAPESGDPSVPTADEEMQIETAITPGPSLTPDVGRFSAQGTDDGPHRPRPAVDAATKTEISSRASLIRHPEGALSVDHAGPPHRQPSDASQSRSVSENILKTDSIAAKYGSTSKIEAPSVSVALNAEPNQFEPQVKPATQEVATIQTLPTTSAMLFTENTASLPRQFPESQVNKRGQPHAARQIATSQANFGIASKVPKATATKPAERMSIPTPDLRATRPAARDAPPTLAAERTGTPSISYLAESPANVTSPNGAMAAFSGFQPAQNRQLAVAPHELADADPLLGLSQSGTTLQAQQSPTAPIPSSYAPKVAAQLVASAFQSSNGTTQIVLNPEELGRVRMTLTTTEHGMAVAIAAERPETTDLMRRNIDLLMKEFEDLGRGEITFSFGANNSNSGETESENARDNAVEQETVLEDPAITPILITAMSSGLDLKL